MEGVSTRRVDDLIKSLGCDGISKSQVSRICRDLDEVVENFLGRPLDGGPYPYVRLDALTQKVREGGRIVNVSVVVATGVNAQGQREILGMDVGASEDGAFWLAFLRSLNARGLNGVELVISDAHQGLKNAIATVFAGAGWQRCGTHFMANLLSRVPKRSQPGVTTMVRTIYKQLSPEEVHAQADRVIAQLQDHFPPGCPDAGGRHPRHPGLHRLPSVPLAEALVQQSPGAIEQGDPPAHRRGGYLPQSCRHPTAGGPGAGRATRRMGRGASLPHHHQPPRPCLTSRQHPGGGRLNHIIKDDANYTYTACMLRLPRGSANLRDRREGRVVHLWVSRL